jgi:hypothetical protein
MQHLQKENHVSPMAASGALMPRMYAAQTDRRKLPRSASETLQAKRNTTKGNEIMRTTISRFRQYVIGLEPTYEELLTMLSEVQAELVNAAYKRGMTGTELRKDMERKEKDRERTVN